jgi:hypothetical protein
MAERRPPAPLAQINLTLLDSIRPCDYRESLEETIKISAIAAPTVASTSPLSARRCDRMVTQLYSVGSAGSSAQSRQPMPSMTIDTSKSEIMDHGSQGDLANSPERWKKLSPSDHARILVNGAGRDLTMLEFPTAAIEVEEEQLRQVLSDEFPEGTDSLVG